MSDSRSSPHSTPELIFFSVDCSIYIADVLLILCGNESSVTVVLRVNSLTLLSVATGTTMSPVRLNTLSWSSMGVVLVLKAGSYGI